MTVCRTCLFHLINVRKYPIEQTLEASVCLTESNDRSSSLQLRKMIEKCIPEMDLDICDSPVICENCYKLLMSAYKFRTLCLHTEEKIYQFIEKNNLRLGESIDLINLFDTNIGIKTENNVKEEGNYLDEFADMPNLLPQVNMVVNDCEVSIQESNVSEQENSANRQHSKDKTSNNSQAKSCLENNYIDLTDTSNVIDNRSRRKVQDKSDTLNNSWSESNTSSDSSSSSWYSNSQNKSRKRPRRMVQRKVTTLNNVHSQSDTPSEDDSNNTIKTVNSRGNSKYEKRPFTCNKCQYKSSKLELLQRHVELKCGIKSPTKFKCDKCSYKTIRKRHLKRHQLTHGGSRPWICGICKKEFTEKTFLKYHMFKHRPNKNLPFKCQEEGCSYAATRNCDLTAHSVIHMKEYPLFCKKCIIMSFPSEEELLKHEKRCSGKKSRKNK